MTPRDLVQLWRSEAEILAKYSEPSAAMTRRHADELEAALIDLDDVVTLTEAHLIGGYSIDHLQRLVASGEIPNVGRKNRPRIRRSDVPIKPGHRSPHSPDLPTTPEDVFSRRRRIVASVSTTGPQEAS